MKIKRLMAAFAACLILTMSLATTCFAYTEETMPTEVAEPTASELETEIPANEETTSTPPYTITQTEDGTYFFSMGDFEWSFDEDENSGKVGTVTVGQNSWLNLRTGGGMEYEIIGHLLPGEQVEVIGENGDWYEVVVPEMTGYVHSDYLKVVENSTEKGEMSVELLNFLLAMMMQSQNTVSTGGLTPDGNLTLVDDIGPVTGAGQQFITLVTKNGNTFYLIIDRDDDGNENVHFMNLVDEADLFALLDEDAQADYLEQQAPAVTEPEPTEEEPEVVEQPEEPETPAKKTNWAPLMLLAIVGIGGAGFAGYTMMNKKKKAQEAEKPDPDADYQDEDEEEYDLPEEDDVEDEESEVDEMTDDYDPI